MCWEESLEMARESGFKWWVALLLYGLGFVSLACGHWQRAGRLFAESLALEREIGYEWCAGWCMVGSAGMAKERGQVARAARLLGAADAFLETCKASGNVADFNLGFQADRTSIVSAVRNQLDEEAFAAAWAEGQAMAAGDGARAVAYALGEDDGF